MLKSSRILLPLAVTVGVLLPAWGITAAAISVRVNRWLEVRQVAGQVLFQRGQTSQSARVGTRMETIGDTLVTAERASARLAVDTDVGFVNVSENTALRVQTLQSAPDGGRITRLEVLRGQARLQVRPFTHPSSELEIRTPAAISGVRGTEFGVSVQPDGKTGVATLDGAVAVAAQGEAVSVEAGFQNLTVPGEPPSPPVPLTEDTTLDLRRLTVVNQTVRLVGRVEPVNLLVIAEVPQSLDREGNFDLQVPLLAERRIQAVVITPLGKRQVYELVVP